MFDHWVETATVRPAATDTPGHPYHGAFTEEGGVMKFEAVSNGFYAALFTLALVVVARGFAFAMEPLFASAAQIPAAGSVMTLF